MTGFIGSEQSWYLVLDQTAMIRDQEAKKALALLKTSRKDSNARNYEQEIKMRSGKISLKEIWGIMNPFAMIKFIDYSMKDIV